MKDIKLSDSTYALISGAAFYIGIFLALLIAFLGQKSNQKMLDPVARASLYWKMVAHTGVLNEAVQEDIDGRIAGAMKFARWPSRVGFASLIFFSMGLAAIALGWINK